MTMSPARISQTVNERPSRDGASGLATTHPHSPERSTP